MARNNMPAALEKIDALYSCITHKDYLTMRHLLTLWPDLSGVKEHHPFPSPLVTALHQNDLTAFSLLLDAGADVMQTAEFSNWQRGNMVEWFSSRKRYEMSVIEATVFLRKPDFLQAILQRRRLNAFSEKTITFLRGQKKLLRMLELENRSTLYNAHQEKIDARKTATKGILPTEMEQSSRLQTAIDTLDYDMLIDTIRANPDIVDKPLVNRNMPLAYAYMGQPKMFPILLDLGASPDVKIFAGTQYASTLIEYVMRQRDEKNLMALLSHRAVLRGSRPMVDLAEYMLGKEAAAVVGLHHERGINRMENRPYIGDPELKEMFFDAIKADDIHTLNDIIERCGYKSRHFEGDVVWWKNASNKTALQYAAEEGDILCFTRLMELSPHRLDGRMNKVLDTVLQRDSLAMVRICLENTRFEDETLKTMAYRQPFNVRQMLAPEKAESLFFNNSADKKADTFYKTIRDARNHDSALHAAIYNHNYETLHQLKAIAPDILDRKMISGATPLTYAYYSDNIIMFYNLLSMGASPDTANHSPHSGGTISLLEQTLLDDKLDFTAALMTYGVSTSILHKQISQRVEKNNFTGIRLLRHYLKEKGAKPAPVIKKTAPARLAPKTIDDIFNDMAQEIKDLRAEVASLKEKMMPEKKHTIARKQNPLK